MIDDLDIDLVELVPCSPDADTVHPLREIAFRANAWLPDEDERLRDLFGKALPFDEIARVLGRPVSGVADRAWRLGLRRSTRLAWTDLEDAVLVGRYGSASCAVLAQELGRSCASIYARAQLLGLAELAESAWSAWEDAQLREGYRRALPPGLVGVLIGRSIAAVRSRASKLCIAHPDHPPGWSVSELDRALELAEQGHKYLAIIETLVAEGHPRRTKAGFGSRIRKLGYGRGWGRPWLPEEEQLLRQAYRTGASLTPLRTRLGRTPSSIRWKVKELGLQGTHEKTAGWRIAPIWTLQEEKFLRQHYGKMNTRELATAMGRPRMAVLNRAWTLGLKHGYWRPYTADELAAFRIAFANGIAIADLAIALDRHAMTVSKYATDKLGIHFGRRRRMKSALSLDQILELESIAP
ncbi:MAG: hypothetical protein P4L68_08045 [Methylovirgula sp.]|nr:hypothetical protein [Methylovirgula sp.]